MEGNKPSVGANAVNLVGEAIMPGTSQLLSGKVAGGSVHLIAGLLARALLGPVGHALVAANSFSNSTTGEGLLKNLRGGFGGGGEGGEQAAAPAAPASDAGAPTAGA